jgi:hypothetical protein
VLDIIRFLRGEPGSAARIDELQRQSSLGFVEFSELLLELQHGGVLSLQGSPGHEMVTLRADL